MPVLLVGLLRFGVQEMPQATQSLQTPWCHIAVCKVEKASSKAPAVRGFARACQL